LNTKELTEIVNKQNLTLAEINQALAQMTRNSLVLHESIKSLETTALAHDSQIGELIDGMEFLKKEWQAYLSRQPRT